MTVLAALQVFDLDSAFFGKDILDFGGFGGFTTTPSSPSDCEPPCALNP